MSKTKRLIAVGVAAVCVLALVAAGVYGVTNDTTPPSTTSDALAVYMGDADIEFSAMDDADGDGVAYMYYRVDRHRPKMFAVTSSASHAISVPAPATGSATHTIKYWSQDEAGNVERVNTMSVVVRPAPALVPCHFSPIEGGDRYLTAIQASKAGFESAPAVVIARGDGFADALGGSALAGAVGGPLLLSPQLSVPQAVLDEITRLGASKVYVLGGTGAISGAAFDQLKATAGSAERIAGTDRYATASLIADKAISILGASFQGKVFLATGTNFPDALGASPIAYAKGMPIVLVNGQGAFALPAGVNTAYILGGEKAVPSSVETVLGSKFGGRLAGDSRYATCAEVADFGVDQGMSWNGVGIATGASPADALSGGAMLGSRNSVMLLTPAASLSADASARLAANRSRISEVYYLGGLRAVSQATRTAVEQVLSMP